MIQEIVSYCIIGGAVSLVALKSARLFLVSANKRKKNSKCASCSAECVLKEFTLENKDNCPTKKELDMYL
jgi:hypothetical protein